MPYSVILRRLMQLTSSGVLWQGLRPCAVKCWGQGVPLLLVFLMPGFAPRVAQSFSRCGSSKEKSFETCWCSSPCRPTEQLEDTSNVVFCPLH